MKFYELPLTLNADIKKYEELIDGYFKGEVDKVKLKSFRVPMGVYEQRKNDTYMLRVRTPAGNITASQLQSLGLIAKKYSDKPLHLTTRQEIQLHNLSLENTAKIMRELEPIGLSSRGGGGNTVRNIIGSYDAGFDANEAFDIMPYICELTTRMIAESDSWTLPRKFKIAFSRNSEDSGNATIADLGFIAKVDKNDNPGFKVFIAGGLGHKPQAAKLLFEFIETDEVYNIVKTAKTLFDRYGDRKNKNAARLRFVWERLGAEKFIEIFDNLYSEITEKKYSALDIQKYQKSNDSSEYILIPLLMGDIEYSKIIALAETLIEYGLLNNIRFLPTQNIMIINITADEKKELMIKLKKIGFFENNIEIINNGIVCAGAATCRLGICLSRGLFEELNKKFITDNLTHTKIKDIKLRVSGCPNACGQHFIGDIGLFGGAKRINNKLAPYYNILAGAIVSEHKTLFGNKIGSLPAKFIPDYLTDVLKTIIKTRNDNEDLYDYFERIGKKIMTELLDEYKNKISGNISEDIYTDWSAAEPFNIADKLEGECSAGIYDLINWDFSNIKNYIEQLKNADSNDDIQTLNKKIIVSASRALLITKGFEPQTETEAVDLFDKYFIDKHIDLSYREILEKYFNGSDIKVSEALDLYETVFALYNSMDNSLKFPELEKKQAVETAPVNTIKTDNFKDFRGVPCPLNFVKTKLALEMMNDNAILEILLDDGQTIENVPLSVANEGHQILSKSMKDNYWSVIIQKKGN